MYIKISSKYISKYLDVYFQNIYLYIFRIPPKIFKNPSNNIKNLMFVIFKLLYFSHDPNLPSKHIGIAGGNCTPYFRVLAYSEDSEPL